MAQADKTDFFERVYALVRQIPEGRITTYGAIARHLGSVGSSRMVGWAMNAAHSAALPVPAHRVVNRNGLLTGKFHFGHADLMQQLLENEGILVVNDKIVAFDVLFWENWH